MPVYKNENAMKNQWYYSFQNKDAQGTLKTNTKRGFRTKKEAENAEISVKDSINKGTFVKQSKLSYGDYLINWLNNRRDIRDRTKEGYLNIIRKHITPAIGRVTLSEITPMVIENFLTHIESKGNSESFNRNIFKVLFKSLGDAERKQLIIKNPAAHVSKPKVSRIEMHCWSPDEAKIFLKAIHQHRLRIIFVLAIHCGMRSGEILGLRYSDIDLPNQTIHIRNILNFKKELQAGAKTKAGNRSISISSFVVNEILKRRGKMEEERIAFGEGYENKDFVVCSKHGTPYSKSMCDKVWRRLIKKSGVRKIRFHDLRHTCASLLLSLGIHPKVVQEQLGHSSISMTLDTYSHLAPNMQGEAASALENLLN